MARSDEQEIRVFTTDEDKLVKMAASQRRIIQGFIKKGEDDPQWLANHGDDLLEAIDLLVVLTSQLPTNLELD